MAIAAGGLALARLAWQPPVLGYLLTGLLIGPYTLPNPLIGNLEVIGLLAELGLVLLLFGIGLELGWRRIQSVGFRVLVIGAVEISVLTFFGVWLASAIPGIPDSHGLYLGGALAISSSAILLKGLRDTGNLRSGWGQTIVGILLVEDFAAVILLTILTGLATTGTTSLADVGWLVGKLAIFCIAVLTFGALLVPRVMRVLGRGQTNETLLIGSLGLCFLLALCANLLGLSSAAGAFLIGVVIGDTAAANRVTRLVSPVRDMFGALFFLSIGMLIDYRTLDDYILPALAVVAVFMVGKMVANLIGSIMAGRNPRDAVQVGMSMPQMGEFSLAIGRVSPTDAMGAGALGPILAIATAITSVLAPLTRRFALPLCLWIERSAPSTLHEVTLSIQLGVDTFWSSLSIGGNTGNRLRILGRNILIDMCIIAVITAIATVCLYTLPNVLPISQSTFGLIMGGTVVGLSTPPMINMWRSLRVLARLATGYTEATSDTDPLWRTLRAMVQNGLATVLLLALFILTLPLVIRLFALGSLSTPLSLLLLLAPALAMSVISFRVHRILEPAFRDTFIPQPSLSVPDDHEADEYELMDVEMPGPRQRVRARQLRQAGNTGEQPSELLVAAAIEHLDERDELWALLEERVTARRENAETGERNNEENRGRQSAD